MDQKVLNDGGSGSKRRFHGEAAGRGGLSIPAGMGPGADAAVCCARSALKVKQMVKFLVQRRVVMEDPANELARALVAVTASFPPHPIDC